MTAIDRFGWTIVSLSLIVVLSVLLFDNFLANSNAITFANYVNADKAERHLDDKQTKDVYSKFSSAPPFANIRIASIDRPEAAGYAQEFISVLHQAKQKVNGILPEATEINGPTYARLYSPKMHGLFIGVKNGAPITPEALRFKQLMRQSGITFVFTPWDNMGANDFIVVIGPP